MTGQTLDARRFAALARSPRDARGGERAIARARLADELLRATMARVRSRLDDLRADGLAEAHLPPDVRAAFDAHLGESGRRAGRADSDAAAALGDLSKLF